MGSVFGKVGEETPRFDVLGRIGPGGTVEVRRYGEMWLASVSSTDVPEAATREEFQGVAFRALARYIGVFSRPANAGSVGISMTAPVVLTSADSLAAETGRGDGKPVAIAMTAPVVLTSADSLAQQTGRSAQAGDAGINWTMSFVLPSSRFVAGGEVPPRPTDPRVRVSKLPPVTKAVLGYSWFISTERNEAMKAELLAAVREAKRAVKLNGKGEPIWEVLGYNSPFTLPWTRTNEVTVLLDEELDAQPPVASSPAVI
jgi:hypothetical protein